MLTGTQDIEPISFAGQDHRINFLSHLKSIHEKKLQIERSKWENWLYAMAIKDILKPLAEIMMLHGINKDEFESFSANQYRQFIDAMPTRQLDVHLHRQVLKNPEFKPKPSDLEDWAGLGTAACYCDLVVCEKHFADMIERDSFNTKAIIETNLYNMFKNIG